MKHEKHKNLAMIVVATAILAAVNLGVWLAAQHGMIAPIGNLVLWTAFAVLNVVSLVWAISLLGLQPLVVAVSYLAGGFLAFKGVQGVSGVSVAEITTAGSTYGAFGALAVCNCTAKVRLTFFRKGQAPFIFIIAALLVFDAVLNSGISSVEGSIVLNAVVFPFVLAGVIVGLVWSVLARYGIGNKPVLKPVTVISEAHVDVVEEAKEPAKSNTLKIQMPVHVEPIEEIGAVAAVADNIEVTEKLELPVEDPVKIVLEQEENMIEQEEEFFPLEIDKDNDFIVPQDDTDGTVAMSSILDDLDEDLKSLMDFDTSLYYSDENADDPGAVMVEEPVVSLSLDIIDEAEAEPVTDPAAEVIPEPMDEPIGQSEPEPVSQVDPVAVYEPVVYPEPVVHSEPEPDFQAEPEPAASPIAQAEAEPVSQVEDAVHPVAQAEAEPIVQPEPAKRAKSDDWLSGHLDLLSKLK